jgi:hypothetical protein
VPFAAGDGLPRTTRSDDRSLGAFAAGEDVSLNSGAAGAGRLRCEVPIVPPRALAGRPEPFLAGRPPDVRPPSARSEPDRGPAGCPPERADGFLELPRVAGGFPVPERAGGFPTPERDAPAFPAPERAEDGFPAREPPALERSSRPRLRG